MLKREKKLLLLLLSLIIDDEARILCFCRSVELDFQLCLVV